MNARISRVVLSLSLTAAVGFSFTPVGCGSSIPATVSAPADADLMRQLRACAAEHEGHLGYAPRSMSFDVSPPCAVGLALIVGASFIAVTLYIYANADPTLMRPRPPVTLATSMPTATAVPTATAMPPATRSDDECRKVKQDCIVKCSSKRKVSIPLAAGNRMRATSI